MLISCQAVAISQAGDVFESNFLPIQFLIVDDFVSTAPPVFVAGGANTNGVTTTDGDGAATTEQAVVDLTSEQDSTATSAL